MNTEQDISKRLLRLFPVSILKSYFNQKGVSQEHLIRDIVDAVDSKAILNFANIHFENTKQHIYIYESNTDLKSNLNLTLPEKPKYDFLNTNGDDISLTYFVPVQFSIYEIILSKKTDLTFLCPVRVVFNKKTKIIQLKITILERQDKSHFQNKVYLLSKDFDESSIISHFERDLIQNKIYVYRIDLNKGVKEIWNNDIIEVTSVKYKKSRSTSTETMDENYSLKKDLPDIYKVIIQGPLEGTSCKFLNPAGYLPYFRVEPTTGFLAFSIYPPSLDSVNNVVNLILKHN